MGISPSDRKTSPNPVESYSTVHIVSARSNLVLDIGSSIPVQVSKISKQNIGHPNLDPERVKSNRKTTLEKANLTSLRASKFGYRRPNDHIRQLSLAMSTEMPKQHCYPRSFPPMEAFDQIDAFCEGSGIPKAVIDMAKYFYTEAHGGGLFRHRCSTQPAMVAGCIFVACRQCELPRSFQEISKLTNVSKSDLGKKFKLLNMFFSSQAYFKVEDEGENSAETAYGSFPPVDQYWVVKMLTLDT